jgi:hypothetical protein
LTADRRECFLNKLGKLCFSLTALAPCAFAYAVNRLSHSDYSNAALWVTIGLLMCFVCWGILRSARRMLEAKPLNTKKVKLADKEILAFLLAYLIPLASTATVSFSGDLLTAVFVYLVIGLCVYHSNAFTFNPLLAIFGYHFYEVENEDSMTYLLLTKKPVHACEGSYTVVSLGEYLYLDVGA